MKTMKVLSVILGFLLLLGGIGCLLTPGLTYYTLTWVISLAMFVHAIGDICAYTHRRAFGLAGGWTLAGAIISLILAVILLFSNTMQFVVGTLLIILAAVWMLLLGVIRIVTACKIHAFRRTLPEESQGSLWLITLVFGLLMVLVGIIGLINPLILAATIGVLISLYLILSGITLIASCFA